MLNFSAASGRGDPHYTTFDQDLYHFYTVGIYTLFGVKINGNDIFHMEGFLAELWPGGRRRVSGTYNLRFGVPGEYGYQVHKII